MYILIIILVHPVCLFLFFLLQFCLLFFPFVYKFVYIFPGNSSPQDKTGFEFQRISIDRTKMSEEEAFEHAIEMIQTRQMGFRKAADFFSVSLFLGLVWLGLGPQGPKLGQVWPSGSKSGSI